MSKLVFDQIQRILCLGAHPDDLEIGCGGAMLRLLAESSGRIEVHWIVFSGTETRRREAQSSANEFLVDAKRYEIILHDFKDSYFPAQWADIKKVMGEASQAFNPDLVFTHHLEDRHQDHRTVAELTWNHFRKQTILEYEIPKYEGDLHTPNFYVGLDLPVCNRKVELLERNFASQQDKTWYDSDTFWAMLRLRGVESGVDAEFAEGFHARKIGV